MGRPNRDDLGVTIWVGGEEEEEEEETNDTKRKEEKIRYDTLSEDGNE